MRIKKIVTGYLEENCYITYDGKNALIIDPGADFDKIEKFIDNEELNINGILITHHHHDHIGALEECKNKYKAKVYDHSSNKVIKVGKFEFKIIPTKGHTDDSVTFYFEEENIMFTGDFLFKGTIGRYDFENSSLEEMQESIKDIKLYDKKIRVYPGHGNVTTLREEFKNNYYLK